MIKQMESDNYTFVTVLQKGNKVLVKQNANRICSIKKHTIMDTNVLSQLTYGMYIIGVYDGKRAAGCIANTCFQITSAVPRVAVSLNKSCNTLQAIRRAERFSISIISENTDPLLIGTFGFSSSHDHDKYADVGLYDLGGTPMVSGSMAGRLVVHVEQYVDCDTHMLVIGRVTDAEAGTGHPMTYAYYHNVIKGSAPKSAPTYRPPTPTPAQSTPTGHGKRRYECDICGYEVEVDGELPDDYICPVCGADRSHFHEITT